MTESDADSAAAGAPREKPVTLREIREADLSSTLTAHVDGDGRLVLSGHDLGPRVAQIWPDDEYEYWLVVAAEHVGEVVTGLAQLLAKDDREESAEPSVTRMLQRAFSQELFTTDSEFREWLTAQGIPSEFSSWT